MGISENIKILRERYNLTQHDLAEIAGVTNKAVSAWETGQKEPRMGAIEKIAAHFQIKKSNLIEDGGMDITDPEPVNLLNDYFESSDFTADEIKEIVTYAEYIKSKRNQ